MSRSIYYGNLPIHTDGSNIGKLDRKKVARKFGYTTEQVKKAYLNWKKSKYRTTCFLYHKKKCVCCSEKNVVTVHHHDENKKNNDPRNLVPLCPTHHHYVHSRYKHLVIDEINDYIKKFKKKFHYQRL